MRLIRSLSEKKLFETALEQRKKKKKKAVFIDDFEGNLEMAENCGFIPVKMERYNKKKKRNRFAVIKNLYDLEIFLKNYKT